MAGMESNSTLAKKCLLLVINVEIARVVFLKKTTTRRTQIKFTLLGFILARQKYNS